MTESYIRLGIATLFPVFLVMVFYLLDNKTKFGKLPYWVKQVIYGICFGGLAIVGTEWGIPLAQGAMANCRDGAVMTAGFLLGGPAGIIAGIIGGAERWIAVAWGIGSFTRVACTFSTILAGFYSAALRKFICENRRPNWMLALTSGVVMEVFHLTMVFITNIATPVKAMDVVMNCSAPMIVSNGAAVMLSAMGVMLLAKEPLFPKRTMIPISSSIQKRMLVSISLAFVLTSFFVFVLQHELAVAQADKLLTQTLSDVKADVDQSSDMNLLDVTRRIAQNISEKGLENADLREMAKEFEVDEINFVDKDGVIVKSTLKKSVGFHMDSTDQSVYFMDLLDDKEELVQSLSIVGRSGHVRRKYAGVRFEDGFIQVSSDPSRFQKNISETITLLTANKHIGETGYLVILDSNQEIVSSPEAISTETLQKDLAHMTLGKKNVTSQATIGGVECFTRNIYEEGYVILGVYPREEAYQIRNTAIFVNTYVEILVFGMLFALIYLLIKRIVVVKIENVNESLGKITAGDLDEKVDVRSNEEFSLLSDDINQTVDALKHYIDEANKRIDKELQLAKDIQTSALPSTFPKRKDFDLYAQMHPAKEVGGDFYDFYLTSRNTLHFLIADTSGKGIPAAMFMMRAKTELKSLTEEDAPLSEVFTRGNSALCEGNDAGMFVTAWQASVDLSDGLLTFANAGHNPPLIRHNGGKFDYLRARPGFILAGMEGVQYKTEQMTLVPGDIVFLYTDGVTEATNKDNELYGEKRLQTIINSCEFESVKDLCERVMEDVNLFVGEAPQFDDITMVAFRYDGQPEIPMIHFDHASTLDVRVVTALAEKELSRIGCQKDLITRFNIAIDEVFSNIVQCSYKEQEPGPITVQIMEKSNPRRVCVRFEDEGIPRNPLIKGAGVEWNLDENEMDALGFYVVKEMMDDIKYKYENGKNILTIVKNISD